MRPINTATRPTTQQSPGKVTFAAIDRSYSPATRSSLAMGGSCRKSWGHALPFHGQRSWCWDFRRDKNEEEETGSTMGIASWPASAATALPLASSAVSRKCIFAPQLPSTIAERKKARMPEKAEVRTTTYVWQFERNMSRSVPNLSPALVLRKRPTCTTNYRHFGVFPAMRSHHRLDSPRPDPSTNRPFLSRVQFLPCRWLSLCLFVSFASNPMAHTSNAGTAAKCFSHHWQDSVSRPVLTHPYRAHIGGDAKAGLENQLRGVKVPSLALNAA